MIRIAAIGIIISIFLTGCIWGKTEGENNVKDNVNKDNIESRQAEETLATKEFLMETFQLSEEEIEPYHVEEFISYYELTEQFFLDEKDNSNALSDIVKEFERLQKNMQSDKEDESNDFSYLVEAEEFKGDFPDMQSARYLAVSHQLGDGGTSFLIDFDKNIIYDSPQTNNVYENIQYAQNKVELTDEMKAEIIQSLKEAKIQKWKYEYSGEGEFALENWWHLGIEFEDGTVISYSGAGAVPSNYKPLSDVLFKR